MFYRNPMLRLAIPFMTGIAVAWLCAVPLWLFLSFTVLSVLLLLAGMARRAPATLFGVAAMLAMFSLGAMAMNIDKQKDSARWSGEKGRFEALLLEVPKLGERTAKTLAMVQRIGRDSVPDMRREGLVYIYFANSVEAQQLQVGERVCFESKVQPPRNAGNPAEFDVENYYAVKGVTGSVYLPIDGWYSTGVCEPTLAMKFLLLREKIVSLFSSLGFDGNELSVLSALTVGEKRDLSQDIKELYAAVGASHILAISGLHVGIFYMIITLLFSFGGNRGAMMLLREGIAILLLWMFAAVAGFTPSVLRAAIIFTMLAIGKCLRRDNSSVNTLAFTAIAMLLCSPRYLFDVGFQLSFASVLSILLLAPCLQRWLRADNYGRFYGYVAGIVSISVAAQAGTFPFVWYYFGTFPLYFLLTNLLVVPAAFVIMLLSLLLLLPLSPLQCVVAWLLQHLIGGMNASLNFISEMPGASLELPYVGLWGVAFVTLLILLFLHGVACRRPLFYVGSPIVMLLFALGVFVAKENKTEEPYMLFFNSDKCPVAQFVKSSEESYIVSSLSSLDVELDYVSEPYWRREGIDTPQWLSDGFSGTTIRFKNNMAEFCGRRMMVLADDCWKENEEILPVDCLFLCRGFLGSIKELFSVYPATCIVLDATLYEHSRRRIVRECNELGLRYIDLSQAGAVKWLCNKPGFVVECMRDK